MSEPVTQSQLTEVLETMKAMQSQLAELTLEVKVGHAEIREKFNTIDQKFQTLEAKFEEKLNTLEAKFDEKFNTIEAKIEAVRLEVQTNREQLVDLGKRQGSTENRLWALLVALFLMVAGLLAKITLFDQV
ncbi:hypothetical protein RHP47_09160 [Thermosynechococcus sp. QKsg1]|uniref:hypothetical protein n=1 Tax=unclassified Thermosynechococcus TaxID=2622553 RepID=UPI00122E771E|nr:MULTISPECIES: hypothetical protein [unclassified Thermosynechococcus]QEQ01519.1 hypothetical protein FFX45_09120 [Thermosynechococcus sp. CL-1]WJI23378.1 hypothetical protein MZ909_09120 [Thermosynechococcus sp. B0]WNC53467.1 hypothetical protein RHJ02_03865 [Thermosynechococcus sp. TG215]WNC58559.1 hypothetical protein RHJ13_03875 [Thermosynechococcus sp. TG218]WNC86011.1 hypothetical protein RHP47_09160 [Thermosynechococcus sp. QKsg1]